ncbi:WD40 repeat [Arabidopsis thaliana x Arabidopsis arenosa]|uniref:WD40 repeat n=1 Tax=Arabidopsis thaliana x Arabidopsis arenosa TaxID=1240361 RepID=A0A8T2D1X5_9BRAS|nr:WD40 repeat [Arabidopsis thaliana x Arabidopsis arenosa]
MTQSICSSSQDQSSSPRSLITPRKSATKFHRRRGRSVFNMLVQREMSPKAKFVPRKRWGKSRWYTDSSCGTNNESMKETGQSLTSWVEAESLQHLSAKYCPLGAPPRSTIAAAFSTDGRTLASTHGDHTVKIIDCETGNCLKVLTGHRRTPWVVNNSISDSEMNFAHTFGICSVGWLVRFHPHHSEIVASGSLDLEVRLWNTTTSECIRSHLFYRPIASIAFHAEGELLAVASGHKLHMWHYNRRGEGSSPTVVLKTRRSLRAVHFHPHGAPLLLTAEVNEIDSLDSSMSRATSMGYLRYPPPAILFTSTESNQTSLAAENENRTSSPPLPLATSSGPSGPNSVPGNSPSNIFLTRAGDRTSPAVDGMDVDEAQPVGRNGIPSQVSNRSDFPELGQIRQLFHFRDRVSWELPFLQGWLMAQGHGVANPVVTPTGSSNHGISAPSSTASLEAAVALLEIPSGVNLHAVSRRGGAQEQTSQPQFSRTGLPEGVSSRNTQHGSDAQPVVNRVQSELATSIAASAAAAAAAELPCTVKLRMWSHDIKDPYAQLKSDRCLFTIPHAVLCSEMGAHYSPCGRYLAACVACVFPHGEIDPGLQTQAQQDSGLATSPTRHPVTAHQVIYELRVYSLQKESFGSVLVSRAIRAAHCLTSIQFSPTSEHILLAYGRRHGSLLRSIVSDGETTSHFFTVLEIYRVSDMELVRVLPSSEDEVNVACFHPSPGGGLVYGTKEGKLRIFQYNTAATSNFTGPNT